MAEHALYDKRKLCYTEVVDFTDFQGIGRDPLYKRFDSVDSVIEKNIDPQYRDFLSHPIYSADDDQIFWYVREWKDTPFMYKDLTDAEKEHYRAIKENTLAEYEKVKSRLAGEDKQILTGALKYIDEDFMFCYDDKVVVVAWGMCPDTHKHVVKGAVIHDLKIQNTHKVRFNPGEHGVLTDKLAGIVNRPDGAILSQRDIPEIIPNKGYVFKSWEPNPIGVKINRPVAFTATYENVPIINDEPEPIEEKVEDISINFACGDGGELLGEYHIQIPKGTSVPFDKIPSISTMEGYEFDGWDIPLDSVFHGDTVITARFKRRMFNCTFNAGEHGSIEGNDSLTLPYGTQLKHTDIPNIKVKKGYKFIGWGKTPADYILNSDTTFTAQYEKEEPWYKKIWAWFKGKGCLKWLLWLLLLLLLLFLLSQLLRGCDSSSTVLPSDKIETPSGEVIDDNGSVECIVGEDGSLPDNNVVAPIVGDDGSMPPIIENPGAPDIIGNRLNIYFEDANVNLEQFVSDLSKIYSEDQCKVIGADRLVPMLQILVPEDQRDMMRETLNSKLPAYEFFIVDESIFSIVKAGQGNVANAGWHLEAIDLKEGWRISKGSRDIVVAVVDDGIDASHSILKGRIVNAYNVFTQNNKLSIGMGHGTHVAGLAVGSDKLYDEGISGVAPKCMLMPIQVFDNEICTFSSITSGIMYAIHNGADVVNVSIGPNFRGLDILPIADQDYIAKTQFKNEERVWTRIINVANEHNSIIVFAVGNDNILASIPPENRTESTVNVAAVDQHIKGTDFTNYGRGSNISAPGKDIASSVPINDFAVFDGTSMAAPIVSGTIALMKCCNPDISVNEVLHILQATGEWISEYVPPMIQVDDALIAVTTGVIPELPARGTGSPGNSDGGQDSWDSPVAPSENDSSQPTPATGGGGYPGGASNPMPSDGSVGGDSGASPSQGGNPGQNPDPNTGTDYDAIRKLIEAYKQKIKELEKLLPENN